MRLRLEGEAAQEAFGQRLAQLLGADLSGGWIVLLHGDLGTGKTTLVRGVLRGMARERRSMGIGAGPPCRLERSANGLLTLVDPAVGRRISLDPFGPTNAGAFARLLHDSPPAMSHAGNDTNDDQEG